MTRHIVVSALVLVAVAAVRIDAQTPPVTTRPSGPISGNSTPEGVYRAACLTCHGADGTGDARAALGNVSPPDFSDCAFASAEPDGDWQAVVHGGGPTRALDRHMPAFADALSPEEIALAVSHLRTFCKEPAWPRGDLNLPRAFHTEKAFPENELVWATAFTGRDRRTVANELIYERRLGARNQVELLVPIDFRQAVAGEWQRGLGDVALAFKRAFYASMQTGAIAAAGMEVVLPTGKEALGLGNGFTVVEPFGMWGLILPRGSFLQMHGGLEIPSDSSKGVKEAYLRTSIGTTLAQDRGFGRAWSMQVETLWARPEGGMSEWDLAPQVQVSLSRLQHVLVAGGVRIPLNQRDERSTEVLVYLLWDWFDGSFFRYWK
jgi:mono/diheme cytochrome c family protein